MVLKVGSTIPLAKIFFGPPPFAYLGRGYETEHCTVFIIVTMMYKRLGLATANEIVTNVDETDTTE